MFPKSVPFVFLRNYLCHTNTFKLQSKRKTFTISQLNVVNVLDAI